MQGFCEDFYDILHATSLHILMYKTYFMQNKLHLLTNYE